MPFFPNGNVWRNLNIERRYLNHLCQTTRTALIQLYSKKVTCEINISTQQYVRKNRSVYFYAYIFICWDTLAEINKLMCFFQEIREHKTLLTSTNMFSILNQNVFITKKKKTVVMISLHWYSAFFRCLSIFCIACLSRRIIDIYWL